MILRHFLPQRSFTESISSRPSLPADAARRKIRYHIRIRAFAGFYRRSGTIFSTAASSRLRPYHFREAAHHLPRLLQILAIGDIYQSHTATADTERRHISCLPIDISFTSCRFQRRFTLCFHILLSRIYAADEMMSCAIAYHLLS